MMQHTNGLVLMTFLTSFTIATISQAFLFSVFFSKANLAAACGGILYFLLYLPYTLLLRWEDYMNFSHKAASVSHLLIKLVSVDTSILTGNQHF